MAIYHCRFKVHSRGGGAKATQAAAYRSGSKVVERGTNAVRAAAYRSGGRLADGSGEVHDFSRKHGVVWNGILAPENAPAWVYSRNTLWNRVEEAEKRKDAQLFREAELTIPRELSAQQRVALVRAFVQDQFVSRGMIADIGIHCPKASDGGEQPHAHVMLTMRDIGPDGFGLKRRDWNDLQFTTKETRQTQWKQLYAGENGLLRQAREQWAAYCNAALADAGSTANVDHRSLKEQRRDRERQPYQGKAAHVAQPSGRIAGRSAELHRVKFENRARAAARAVQRPAVSAVASKRMPLDPFEQSVQQAAQRIARTRAPAREEMDRASQQALTQLRRTWLYAPTAVAPDPTSLWDDRHDR